MSRYAKFEARPAEAGPVCDVSCVRVAAVDDVDAIVRISAERDGQDADAIREPVRKDLAAADGLSARVFVAEVDGAVVAYGRVRALTHGGDALPEALPEGWWLNGVVVRPGYRRRGLGAALTARRLAWVGERAAAIHYVSNVANRVSHALHARFGFEEIVRGFDYPRAGLSGDEGVAFRARLSR